MIVGSNVISEIISCDTNNDILLVSEIPAEECAAHCWNFDCQHDDPYLDQLGGVKLTNFQPCKVKVDNDELKFDTFNSITNQTTITKSCDLVCSKPLIQCDKGEKQFVYLPNCGWSLKFDFTLDAALASYLTSTDGVKVLLLELVNDDAFIRIYVQNDQSNASDPTFNIETSNGDCIPPTGANYDFTNTIKVGFINDPCSQIVYTEQAQNRIVNGTNDIFTTFPNECATLCIGWSTGNNSWENDPSAFSLSGTFDNLYIVPFVIQSNDYINFFENNQITKKTKICSWTNEDCRTAEIKKLVLPTCFGLCNDLCSDNKPLCEKLSLDLVDNPVNDFVCEFAPKNWSITAPGDSSITFNGDDDEATEVTLTGDPNGPTNQSALCITPNKTTIFKFDWSYSTQDVSPLWDPFGYTIDNTFFQLTDNNGPKNQSGSETIFVFKGQTFCFVQKYDFCCGSGTTTVSNFSICCLTVTIFTDFKDNYAPKNWSISEPGDSSVIFNGDKDQATELTLISADDAGGSQNALACEMVANKNSLFKFDWSYSTRDFNSFWDPFGYTIDGTFFQLTINGPLLNQNGSETVAVLEGQTFCFLQNSRDSAVRPATTVISNFSVCEFTEGCDKNILCIYSVSEWPGCFNLNKIEDGCNPMYHTKLCLDPQKLFCCPIIVKKNQTLQLTIEYVDKLHINSMTICGCYIE
jgi:hypothetical protein